MVVRDEVSSHNRRMFAAQEALSVEQDVCQVSAVHPRANTLADESAGEIIEVGPEVTDFKVGDRVASAYDVLLCALEAEFYPSRSWNSLRCL